MGFTRGFIEFERIEQPHVSVEERVKSFCEISRIWRKKVYINFINKDKKIRLLLEEWRNQWYNIMGYYFVLKS